MDGSAVTGLSALERRPPRWNEPGGTLDAAAIPPSLSPQEWLLNRRNGQQRDFAFLITGGTGVLHDTESASVAAPALAWIPAGRPATVGLAAGARGHRLALEPNYRARYLADATEAPHLLRATDDLHLLSGHKLCGIIEELEISFLVLAREAREPGLGAHALFSAHLSVIALHLWRLSNLSLAATEARGGTLGLLHRFRQLVEDHYRDHWTIADYARMLGVTEDRLHALCVRGTGRPPRTLVHERLIEEASARLQHLDWPIEQIGFSLGFKDAGYFNRFFKKHVGLPPGAYRGQRKARTNRTEHSYAAWP